MLKKDIPVSSEFSQEQIELNRQTDDIINLRLCEIVRNKIIMNKSFLEPLKVKVDKLISDELFNYLLKELKNE